MPDKIVGYRSKTGIYREPIGSLAKEGGAVAASNAELLINGKTYQVKTVYGASVEARIKPGNSVATRAERSKIRSKYIAINKKRKTPVTNKQATDHAEQDNLAYMSDEIDKVLNSTGVSKKNLQGKVYMHVDRKVCEQCTANIFNKNNTTKGPIYLFSKEYPNIDIYITNDDIPNFVLKVKDGKQF